MAFNQLCTISVTLLSSANFWSRKCSFAGEVEVRWRQVRTVRWMFQHLKISEHVVYPLCVQLFNGASIQSSGHVVRATAQAHTARPSRPLYGILLSGRCVSRNKIFRCAYFSMHFTIKFLLFNDFPSYFIKIIQYRNNKNFRIQHKSKRNMGWLLLWGTGVFS